MTTLKNQQKNKKKKEYTNYTKEINVNMEEQVKSVISKKKYALSAILLFARNLKIIDTKERKDVEIGIVKDCILMFEKST